MAKDEIMTCYSSGSKFFHWVIAVLVILMLAFSFFLGDVPEQYADAAYMIHKSIGLTILGLTILRIIWILYRGKPPLPASVPRWQQLIAHIVQYLLYLFLILMALSGWAMSTAANYIPSYFGLFNVPMPGIPYNEALSKTLTEVHTVIAWTLIVLIVLHIAGAIKHHFIDRDDVLRSMMPRRKRRV